MNKIWNSRYLDQLDYLTQSEFIAAIFCMGLLKKFGVNLTIQDSKFIFASSPYITLSSAAIVSFSYDNCPLYIQTAKLTVAPTMEIGAIHTTH